MSHTISAVFISGFEQVFAYKEISYVIKLVIFTTFHYVSESPHDIHNYTELNGVVNYFSQGSIAPPNILLVGCKPH